LMISGGLQRSARRIIVASKRNLDPPASRCWFSPAKRDPEHFQPGYRRTAQVVPVAALPQENIEGIGSCRYWQESSLLMVSMGCRGRAL
jgi:hypothetical protein